MEKCRRVDLGVTKVLSRVVFAEKMLLIQAVYISEWWIRASLRTSQQASYPPLFASCFLLYTIFRLQAHVFIWYAGRDFNTIFLAHRTLFGGERCLF